MARLIFHRKFGYSGMTRDVAIRIDGETRLRLANGARSAANLSPGSHLIEASIGKENASGVDLVVTEHDEIYFVCQVTHFFHPTPVLRLVAQTTIRQRFDIDRTSTKGNASDSREIATWAGILGVRPDASLEEIHRAYISQMRVCHPDLLANQVESLREISAWRAREINMAYSQARKQLLGK